MAWHYDRFANLTHKAQTAPAHSAPEQQRWDRSTLIFGCEGLYDCFSQSKLRKIPFKYHFFSIWVLLWQPEESWCILSPLRVRNSLGNDTGSQNLLKKKMRPEAEKSHRRFQPKLLTLWVFISNCKQECANHSANSTARHSVQLPPSAVGHWLQRGCAPGLLQHSSASCTSWLPAVLFWW